MCDDDVFAWHGLLLLSNTNRKKSNRLLITVMSAGYGYAMGWLGYMMYGLSQTVETLTCTSTYGTIPYLPEPNVSIVTMKAREEPIMNQMMMLFI